MKVYRLNSLPKNVTVGDGFDKSSCINISEGSLSALNSGMLKLTILKHGNKPFIASLDITLESLSGNIVVYIGDDNASVKLLQGSRGKFDIRLWRNSHVEIGKNTSSNGIKIVCANSSFVCGEDCMFSDDILIQTADQHGIVDLQQGKIVNDIHKTVKLGNHVWAGRRCILTSRCEIGDGSIIGTGAIVTGKIPSKVLAVGTPAKVIKEDTTWCRSPSSLDDFSTKYIEEHSVI